ncbi:hypothetical protein B9Z55_003287 [Caenorhabditis nigoni]|uniref:F-box domain-containing protein n=2 Tax=Caenorhabditis nigoni TaxID=1611254 RepID=A0A2G5VPF4_9PELO|nr:hypothetical protein B9Z55_003287 [Caenorhabditis nigoni]
MKLHRMPLLVKSMILEELGFDERLFLSFTSKRTCSLLELSRNDLKGSIKIHINKKNVSVSVRKSSCRLAKRIPAINISSSMNNEWKFEIPYKQHYLNDSSSWTIDGSSVQTVKDSSTIHCGLIDERVGCDTMSNSMIIFGKVQRHLRGVLNIEKCQLCEFDMTFPAGLIPHLDFNFCYDRIDFLSAFSMCMTLEDLTVLLENIKAKRIYLRDIVLSVPGHKYHKNPELKKSSIDWLEIQNYSWVDFSELPAAKLITIREKVPLDQMKMVLTSWVAGRNRDIEIGDFEVGNVTDRNRETIFSGLKTYATQLTDAEIGSFFKSTKHLPRRWYYRGVVAVDILSDIDGLRATVFEGPIHEYTQRIFMVVWNEENLRKIG